MSDPVANDAKTISDRLKEIEAEDRQMRDVDAAAGEFLDMWGQRVDLTRYSGESDYNFRLRIKGAFG